MYKKGNTYYSDAGKCLVIGTTYAYRSNLSTSDISEVEIDLGSISIEGRMAFLNGGMIAQPLLDRSKKELKKNIIGKHFDNDDQMAIMLNASGSESGAFYYQKMQEWREWAGIMADAIINAINNS